jgi:hypothetical protein
MKHVGIREFRDHATQYLAGGTVLAIERHDQIIGFYIPVSPAPGDKVRPALERLTKAVDRVLAETGMSEAELTETLRPARRRARPA